MCEALPTHQRVFASRTQFILSDRWSLMFLIIGNESDPCAHAVTQALERRHYAVAVDSNPLADAARLRWQFDSTVSRFSYTRGQSSDALTTARCRASSSVNSPGFTTAPTGATTTCHTYTP